MTRHDERAAASGPPFICGDIDIRIAADGTWFHEGGPIGRLPLVKLFAGVLERDEAGDYWLVTPVERARIQVEDAPFLAVEMTATGRGEDQVLRFRTNLDEDVTVGPDHPISFRARPSGDGDAVPYVTVRDGLEARIVRPVYYELAEHCVEAEVAGRQVMGVWSGGVFFPFELAREAA